MTLNLPAGKKNTHSLDWVGMSGLPAGRLYVWPLESGYCSIAEAGVDLPALMDYWLIWSTRAVGTDTSPGRVGVRGFGNPVSMYGN